MNDYWGRPYNFMPPYQQPQQQVQPTVPQMRTNKIFVTSLEDALNRYADPNTVMVYRHQEEKYEYEITTDSQGKKTYKTLEIRPYLAAQDENKEAATPISKEEFEAIKGRLEAVEKEIVSLYKKEKSGGLE